MTFRTIACDVQPPIAELGLNRPEAGNTFTAELLAELAEAAIWHRVPEFDDRRWVRRPAG